MTKHLHRDLSTTNQKNRPFGLLGWLGDLHPLDNAHAERTTNYRQNLNGICLFFCNFAN